MKVSLRGALIAAALSSAAAPALAVPSGFRARADALLAESFAADGPGVAVIVTDDGETVYAGGRGLADLEARTAITPQTVFRVGSITKQFTASVILQLVDEGRISLDDPVSRFLPDYPQPGANATVAQLLNHTVGVQTYTGIPGWMAEANTNRAYTTEELIAVFRDLPSPSQPGERFSYNNSGYVLLGALIERVTGMPWHQAVDQRIARPLGLTTLRYGTAEAETPGMARGYTVGENGLRPANRIHMSVPHAAGGLIGSVEDLARWAQALHHGRVVSPQSYGRMTARTRLPDGTDVAYGFGLSNSEIRGHRGIEHGGGIFGFSTESVYIPEQDIFIAVFTNLDEPQTHPSLIGRRLAALAVGNPYPEFRPQPVEAASLEPWFGVYRLPDGERRFFARDGKLYTHRSGGSELEAFAAGDGRFFYGPSSLTWFRLARDESGTPVIEMHQNGEDSIERSLRSGPIPPPPAAAEVPRAVLETYVGRYALPRGAAIVAWGEGDKLTIQLGGQPPRGLRPTSETEFAVEGVDAQVSFTRDNGAVTHVVLQQGERRMSAPRETATPAS